MDNEQASFRRFGQPHLCAEEFSDSSNVIGLNGNPEGVAPQSERVSTNRYSVVRFVGGFGL